MHSKKQRTDMSQFPECCHGSSPFLLEMYRNQRFTSLSIPTEKCIYARDMCFEYDHYENKSVRGCVEIVFRQRLH
ncbi:hypothetical protein COOONC_25555 [Cooperia oncophora]